ncbi:MAG: quinoprotein glucose dehydrogenase, partial [Devosia sp.]|uniref:outer membrane protein assembly factor BamB family protein n=1 Tax=Devosia sp. TaxID=1871048 RepID=UPI00260D877B
MTARSGWLAAGFTLLASHALAAGPADEWPAYGYDFGESRHSPLTQISPANVGKLKPAWTYHMKPPAEPAAAGEPARPAFSSSQNTPLVVNGMMFVSTPYGRIVALDSDTGKELWVYKTPAGDGPATRGLAYWPGGKGDAPRLISGTRAGKLVALDAKTGAPVKTFGVDGLLDLRTAEVLQGIPNAFLGVTSAPVIYKDIVITGSRTQETPAQGANGRVRAFDVRTGKELWRFNGIPQPGEKFHDTWTGDSWVKRSGVNVWISLTLDAKRGIAYLPFAAPTFDQYGADRPTPSLFSNSVVAVKADTGEYLWHFQALNHDLWDYDLPIANLLDVKKDGKTIPAIAVMSKASLLFLLDRVTGKPIHPIHEIKVPTDTDVPGEAVSPTQLASVTPPLGRTRFEMADLANVDPAHRAGCEKLIKDMGIVPAEYFQPPRVDSAAARFPGNWGGIDWGHTAFDPTTRNYIVNSTDLGSQQAMKRMPDGTYNMRDGYTWFRDPVSRMPCQKPPWGSLYAVNVDTGQIAWRVTLGVSENYADPNTGRPSVGGPITTASGLVFIGATDDKRFRAFDAKTGKELWTVKTTASLYGNPLTYKGKSGKQYVAGVFTGGFWSEPAGADEVTAYALP